MQSLEEVHKNARQILKGICLVCPKCDGRLCISSVPGMGGRGTGAGFRRNIEAFDRLKLNLRTIHRAAEPDLSYHFFGARLSMPILGAPMCETTYNFLGQVDDLEFINSQVEGAESAGTVAFVGDSPDPPLYTMGLTALRDKALGKGVPIIKPRQADEIIKRIRMAEESGALAVGIDVDAAAFDNLNRSGQPVGPLSVAHLKKIVNSSSLPVILKGIMTVDEAILAADIGIAAIVVSNHGGRALDQTPGTAEVLPEIAAAVKGSMKVFIDGGIRSGEDVLKALALGAEAVLVGRPVAIAAVGGRAEGVFLLYQKYYEELSKTMVLTGCADLKNIGPRILWNQI